MDSISPSRIISRFQASFRENSESYRGHKQSGYHTPPNGLSKYSKLIIPNYTSGTLTDSFTIDSDLTEDLTDLCRKLDPKFKMDLSQNSCCEQILQAVQKAVEFILKEKSSIKHDELIKHKQKNKSLKNIIENLQQKIKNLTDREDALKSWEIKLKENEVRILTDKKIISKEKNYINSTKSYYNHLEKEVKKLKETLKSYQNTNKNDIINYKLLSQNTTTLQNDTSDIPERQKLEELVNSLKLEKEKLSQESNDLNAKIIAFEHKKSQFESDMIKANGKLFVAENLNDEVGKKIEDLDKQKKALETEQKRLSVQKKILEVEKDFVLKEKQNVSRERAMIRNEHEILKKQIVQLEKEKMCMQEIQEDFVNIEEKLTEKEKKLKEKEEAIIEDRGALDEAIKNLEIANHPSSREQELESIFQEFQGQIDFYNKEVAEKEAYLTEWTEKLENREKSLDVKYSELKAIEQSLKTSEADFSALQQETIPKLEAQSKKVNNLLKELYIKKMDLDKQKRYLNDQSLSIDKKKKSFESMVNLHIIEQISIWEKRIKSLSDREIEIKNFKMPSSIDDYKRENAIEELRKERVELELERAEKDYEMKTPVLYMEKLVKNLDSLILVIKQKEKEKN
ncbi:hypothetical protein SteCoe_3864 [Stentor coeruleus]|uniref:Uncharacterized protein n=1 Tax=Stentor coeruleus TaxID=5963 RepID=A0A1R2CW18_9CILI|nr:hypothetical protein SteCoe_3864 [Stentor coeruleus]